MQENFSEVKLALIVSTALILLLIILVLIALLIQQKRKLRHTRQLEEMKNQYEKAILQTQLEIQEETYKAVSQNLHDNIAAEISTAMLLLHTQHNLSPELIEKNKNTALQTLDHAIDEMKNLARYMNPSFLSAIGLQEAIRRQLQYLDQSRSVQTSFVYDEIINITTAEQLVIFRIFQETITNILRHAGSQIIEVGLHQSEKVLHLTIKDNGKGFDLNGNRVTMKGSGLMNMKERAAMIGANLDIETERGRGTAVKLTLPSHA